VLNALATAAMVLPSFSLASTAARPASANVGLRLNSTPYALAASSPALVRSRMMSRSNSANAPKIWKMSLPPEVVVSICSVRLLVSVCRRQALSSSTMRRLRRRERMEMNAIATKALRCSFERSKMVFNRR